MTGSDRRFSPRRVVARPCRLCLPIPVPDSGGEEPPIRAVIQVRLAALSVPDSGADSRPVVWRFGYGEGEVVVLPEAGLQGEVF